MGTSDDRMDLLLAADDDGRPVLEDGLPSSSAARAKKPKGSEVHHWKQKDASANDLRAQRWGVVAVQGREGDRQIEALRPLIDLRAREQGAEVRIARPPAELDAKEAADWKDKLQAEVREEESPLYLLMLGDLHHTSAELQHVLAIDSLVGRVHFSDASGETDPDGYAAYAAKVVRFAEAAARARTPDLLFYVVDDGTQATITGKSKLVEPCIEASQDNHDVASVRRLDARTVDDLLEAGKERPSVLLSVSHGLGAPRRGWRSLDEQRRRQGAMVISYDEILDAERVRGRAFLPGGMWFLLACFGAGTPARSVYKDWLDDLAAAKVFGGSVDTVLRSLAPQLPFVAAMPQAALANPEGPLAVVSHLDLAWTYGFSAATAQGESRSARILEPLKIMARGSRVGVAMDQLMEPYLVANDTLMNSYQRQKTASAEGRPDLTDPVERAHLWMQRNDLRGYVLLGDPAARLPIQQNAPRVEAPPPPLTPEVRSAPATPTTSAPAPYVIEALRGDEAPRAIAARAGIPLDTVWEHVAAVLAMARGDEAPRAIAARAGIPLDTLWAWVDAYRAARRSS